MARPLDKRALASVGNTITESSAQLANMLMSALASVQFQDVTRQQIEQVIDALNRLDSHATKRRYRPQPSAFANTAAYLGIYQSLA